MPVRFYRGYFLLVDGVAGDDFEALPVGAITTIPTVTGTSGCVLLEGTFEAR